MPDSRASHARLRPRRRKIRRAHGAVTSGNVTASASPAPTPTSTASTVGSAAVASPSPRTALHAAAAPTSNVLAASSTRRGVHRTRTMLDRSRGRV